MLILFFYYNIDDSNKSNKKRMNDRCINALLIIIFASITYLLYYNIYNNINYLNVMKYDKVYQSDDCVTILKGVNSYETHSTYLFETFCRSLNKTCSKDIVNYNKLYGCDNLSYVHFDDILYSEKILCDKIHSDGYEGIIDNKYACINDDKNTCSISEYFLDNNCNYHNTYYYSKLIEIIFLSIFLLSMIIGMIYCLIFCRILNCKKTDRKRISVI